MLRKIKRLIRGKVKRPELDEFDPIDLTDDPSDWWDENGYVPANKGSQEKE